MGIEGLLERSAERWPDKTALVCGGERRSYASIDQQANRLARALIAAGVSRGDRVAICQANSIDAVAAIFAVLKAGAVFFTVHPGCRDDRIAQLLADSGAVAVIAPAGVPVAPAGVTVLTSGDAPGYPCTPPVRRHHDVDLAALVYTSGSTGTSKGVMLTHRNVLAAADAICEYLALTGDDVILSVLPLAFTYGLGQITTAFRAGATVVLERSSAYPRSILDTLMRERITGLPVVPTLATLLLQQGLGHGGFPHLRYITNAAAALSDVKVHQLRKALPHSKLYLMYGQTECQRASYLPPEDVDTRASSVGIAIPGTSVRIVDAEGNRLPPGRIGELVVSGPHVMSGYWNQPELTGRVLRPDDQTGGVVLHTGDLFRMDHDGFLYFVDRLDDIIKTRGEKVAPRAVEEVIARLPGVAEVSVYGVPDDLLGEAVAAAVTPAPGAGLTAAGIQRHCLRHLEPFMVPRHIDFRAALPVTPNGKVSRRALREGVRHGAAA